MRRNVLKWITAGLGALCAAALGVPAALLVGHPLRRRTISGGEEPIAVGDLARLPEGVPVCATIAATRFDAWTRFDKVALGAVWLLRRGDGVTAWSSTCPHAGCFVDWEPKAERFQCPCHGSFFGRDGERTAGPSPRPMDRLDATVKDGKVLVRFQRFRQATSDKEPV